MRLDFIKNNRVILLFIFALLRNEYFCQEKKDSTYKWGVGVAGTINKSKHDLGSADIDVVKEHSVLSYGINLLVTRKIGKKIGIESGINYLNLAYKKSKYKTPTTTTTLEESNDYFCLPVKVYLTIGQKKINCAINLGTELLYLNYTQSFYKKYYLGRFSFFGLIGVQISYHIYKNIGCFVGLNYHKSFNPFIEKQHINMSADNIYKTSINYFDIPIGLIFKF